MTISLVESNESLSRVSTDLATFSMAIYGKDEGRLVLERLKCLLEQQTEKGFNKYGSTVNTEKDSDPLFWLNHLSEELMDAVVYMQCTRESIFKSGMASGDLDRDSISHEEFVSTVSECSVLIYILQYFIARVAL